MWCQLLLQKEPEHRLHEGGDGSGDESGDGLACSSPGVLRLLRPSPAKRRLRQNKPLSYSSPWRLRGHTASRLLEAACPPRPAPGPLLPLPPSQGLLLALAASPPPEGPCHPGSPPHLTISNRLTPAKPLLQCEVTCPRAAGHGPLGGPGILPTTPLAPPGPAPTRHSVNVRGGNE